SLLACACGATPEQTGDWSGAGGNGAGTGGSSVAGAGGFTNGSAGSASAGGAIGVAGAFGTSGSPGTAGSFAAGGAFGTAGSVGFAGSGGGSTSAAGSGSTGGVGGQGFGGQPHGGSGGSGGQAHGGTGGTGGTVTFTQLYTKYFNSSTYASNCTGGACHNPGTQRGIDFSTQAKGYTSVKNSLNSIISVLSSGSMPRGRPKWSAADLALVKTWQAEGAPNN
ncbi:MAG TPA: hypothetical protein VF294_07940, partial [Polyangiaceae bacterium]